MKKEKVSLKRVAEKTVDTFKLHLIEQGNLSLYRSDEVTQEQREAVKASFQRQQSAIEAKKAAEKKLEIERKLGIATTTSTTNNPKAKTINVETGNTYEGITYYRTVLQQGLPTSHKTGNESAMPFTKVMAYFEGKLKKADKQFVGVRYSENGVGMFKIVPR